MTQAREARLDTVIEQSSDRSYFIYDPEGGQQTFAPDSPEWFVWLARRVSFSFRGPQGHFTARNEIRKHDDERHKQDGGTAYWYAYRRAYRKLHKRYLGTTEKLTLALLEETARSLHEEIVSNLPTSQLLNERIKQKPPPHTLTVGSLIFEWNDDLLSIKTPVEHHYLNRTQAAELLSYLYDQRGRLLRARL